MKQDETCYPWAVPINLYIIDKHNGNQSALARELGVRYDQVARWIKRDCVVIDGAVYCEANTSKKDRA